MFTGRFGTVCALLCAGRGLIVRRQKKLCDAHAVTDILRRCSFPGDA